MHQFTRASRDFTDQCQQHTPCTGIVLGMPCCLVDEKRTEVQLTQPLYNCGEQHLRTHHMSNIEVHGLQKQKTTLVTTCVSQVLEGEAKVGSLKLNN